MPTQDKLIKEFRRLLKAYNQGRKAGRLTPAKPKNVISMESARRRKEADRLTEVYKDAKIGPAHYESPDTKHLREMFERDLKTVTERAEGKDITKLKSKPHLKLVKSVLPVSGIHLRESNLARVPTQPAKYGTSTIREDPSGRRRTGFPAEAFPTEKEQRKAQLKERLRHSRSPLSQFTQAEIETPGGTITPQRTQISPESLLLMPGVTAEQVVKNLRTYKPAKEALITGESARRLYRRFKRLPQHVLDYIDDLRYRTPIEEVKAYAGVPEDIVAMGAWSPKFFRDPSVKKFFERGAKRTGSGKPGEIVISPAGTKIQRGQLVKMGMTGRGAGLLDEPLRTSLHEVGHGFEEMLRKSLTTKGAKWRLSPRLRGLELGMRKTGLSKDYPLGLGRTAEYLKSPHEQFARAFEESGLTEGYSLPEQVWQITGAPPPGSIYRRMLRDALRASRLGKIP